MVYRVHLTSFNPGKTNPLNRKAGLILRGWHTGKPVFDWLLNGVN